MQARDIHRSKREMCKSLVWVLGLCLSRYPFSAVIMTMSCADTRRATAFPYSAGKKRNRVVRQPNIRAVAFSWSSTETGLVNDAEVNIAGVFGEDLLQKHEQYRRRLPGTLCVRPCSFYITKSCNATTVLMQQPADTRTCSLWFCALRKRRAAAHPMDDCCLERSNSCQILAWSRWQKKIEKYLSEGTPGVHGACVACTAYHAESEERASPTRVPKLKVTPAGAAPCAREG